MHSGRQRGFLLELAAEGLLSQLPSLAQQLTDPKVRALDVLGPPVTERWLHWMQSQPRQYQINVIAELADVPTDRARQRARAILSELAPDLTEEARQPGYEFLSALPRSVQRFLVPDPFTGGMTLAANQSPIDPELLLCLLPVDAPPIWSQCQLHKSYQINDLISTVGHGPSYRATREEIPFLVELWLDRSIYPIVEKHEQSFHELAKVSQQREWSRRILRLVDFSIKPRPTFVYDHQPGGDLARLLSTMQQQTSRGFAPDEVLRLIL